MRRHGAVARPWSTTDRVGPERVPRRRYVEPCSAAPPPPVGTREFAAEIPLDLPSLAPGATHLVDVTVARARQGDRAEASLASSTRFIELDAFAWSNNTVRVLARNISGAAFDLGAARLSVAVTKRRIPWWPRRWCEGT